MSLINTVKSIAKFLGKSPFDFLDTSKNNTPARPLPFIPATPPRSKLQPQDYTKIADSGQINPNIAAGASASPMNQKILDAIARKIKNPTNYRGIYHDDIGAVEAEPISPFENAEVTAYNPVPEQTDETPNLTASGKAPIPGMAASGNRNLPFGTQVYFPDLNKAYDIQDRMNKRYNDGGNYFDIAMAKDQVVEAKQFGRQNLPFMLIYPDELE